MLSAEYFCSGSVSKDTFGHYGLASPIYTHFTSPIRRYAGRATDLWLFDLSLTAIIDRRARSPSTIRSHQFLSSSCHFTFEELCG